VHLKIQGVSLSFPLLVGSNVLFHYKINKVLDLKRYRAYFNMATKQVFSLSILVMAGSCLETRVSQDQVL